MGILDEDIARVREASDIVAIISQHLQLKRVGRRFTGLCPFHSEKSPSFSVNAEEGLYYCFGCGAKGDVITFVRELEHLDFAGSVEWLAAKAGITLRYDSRQEGEGRSRRTKLIEAMGSAVDWYHERLLSSPDAAEARKYLRSRGLDGEIVRRYRIGWAPDEWDALVKGVGVPFDRLEAAGLALLNKRNRRQDAFRARVLFPIYDSQGAPVAFGGRVLPGGDGPKYRNSSETPIYAKSKVLYGLNWAKGAIVEADEAIVCEGYTDVIGMARAGLPRAVAPCGTSLTEDHVRLLKRFCQKLVLAFDADAAGDQAAERLYAWEAKYDIEVRVAALPAGQDPGDLAQNDAPALRAAVEDSVPFLQFRYERALLGADTSSPEAKSRAVDRALPVIAEHPNELVRDEYLMKLAGRLQIDDPGLLRRRLKPGARGPVEVVESAPVPSAASSRELTALRLLVHRRAEVVDHLDLSLFVDPVARSAYRALVGAATVQDAIAAADPAAQDLLHRLSVEDPEDNPTAVDVALLVKDALARLRTEVGREGDIALAHEMGGLLDRIQPPDIDITVVDKALELLRSQGDQAA